MGNYPPSFLKWSKECDGTVDRAAKMSGSPELHSRYLLKCYHALSVFVLHGSGFSFHASLSVVIRVGMLKKNMFLIFVQITLAVAPMSSNNRDVWAFDTARKWVKWAEDPKQSCKLYNGRASLRSVSSDNLSQPLCQWQCGWRKPQ